MGPTRRHGPDVGAQGADPSTLVESGGGGEQGRRVTGYDPEGASIKEEASVAEGSNVLFKQLGVIVVVAVTAALASVGIQRLIGVEVSAAVTGGVVGGVTAAVFTMTQAGSKSKPGDAG